MISECPLLKPLRSGCYSAGMSSASSHRPRSSPWRAAALALVCAWGLGTAMPSHAFLGLLGKAGKAAAAAGKAGKAAEVAGSAGKAAAVGTVAAGGAELAAASTRHGLIFAADDAAHLAGKAPLAVADKAMMAATPPEVARYLIRPADTLSQADSTQILSLYQQMMRQAGHSGDFTVVERMPSLQASKQVQPHSSQAPAATTVAAEQRLPAAELSFHALRLLSHAAHGSHNQTAQQELQNYCRNKPAATWQAEQADLCRSLPRSR